ncbi:acyl-CoA dehydrogenase family protein, partial [Patulibacter sp. S7RM1-6]
MSAAAGSPAAGPPDAPPVRLEAQGWEHLFTGEHEELRAAARRWVRREVLPHVDDWERAGWVPSAVFRRAGELGFLGHDAPVELGGQGGDPVHAAVVAQELARSGSAGFAAALGAPITIATPPILRFGTP